MDPLVDLKVQIQVWAAARSQSGATAWCYDALMRTTLTMDGDVLAVGKERHESRERPVHACPPRFPRRRIEEDGGIPVFPCRRRH